MTMQFLRSFPTAWSSLITRSRRKIPPQTVRSCLNLGSSTEMLASNLNRMSAPYVFLCTVLASFLFVQDESGQISISERCRRSLSILFLSWSSHAAQLLVLACLYSVSTTIIRISTNHRVTAVRIIHHLRFLQSRRLHAAKDGHLLHYKRGLDRS